jgi:hypothetical protein
VYLGSFLATFRARSWCNNAQASSSFVQIRRSCIERRSIGRSAPRRHRRASRSCRGCARWCRTRRRSLAPMTASARVDAALRVLVHWCAWISDLHRLFLRASLCRMHAPRDYATSALFRTLVKNFSKAIRAMTRLCAMRFANTSLQTVPGRRFEKIRLSALTSARQSSAASQQRNRAARQHYCPTFSPCWTLRLVTRL